MRTNVKHEVWHSQNLCIPRKVYVIQGAWVAQSVKHLTLAQVMISRFVGSSPTSGSVLTAQSLEPALDSVSPSLSAPPRLSLCLSLSLSHIHTHAHTNKHQKKFFKEKSM